MGEAVKTKEPVESKTGQGSDALNSTYLLPRLQSRCGIERHDDRLARNGPLKS